MHRNIQNEIIFNEFTPVIVFRFVIYCVLCVNALAEIGDNQKH